ncbi:hypothetical protein EOC99_29145 [Mesorhizobium sp. M7A.T.Ca.TU.009.01.1.1]|nr:hypothetical protein EOC99_29145 [Mesorhizobium sp. M7A.T.Ca.TU.009.01.1.1]
MIDLGSDYDVVGATESHQFSWHVQSYLVLLGSKILREPWLDAFLSSVEPTNSKFDTIQRFEIGLSSMLKHNNVKVATLVQPASEQREFSAIYWSMGKRKQYAADLVPTSNVTLAPGLNPVHYLAESIARELGYVKLELLRENPHQIDLAFVDEICDQERLIEIREMVNRSRASYARGSDSLSTLRTEMGPLPTAKIARWQRTKPEQVRVAVVLHLYYVEMIYDICQLLQNIVLPFDMYVTTAFEGDSAEIFSRFSKLAQSVSVYCSENRGRDIGPFVSIYRSGALDRYDAVLKIHSKKSTYSTNGVVWRDRLYGSVAGDSLTVLRSVELIKSGKVGIVGPHRYYLTSDRFWGANRDTVHRLLQEMTGLDAEANIDLGFFAGSMFWFAPKALSPLKNIPETSLVFEAENGQQDGTLAHAIERVFCPVVRSQGFAASSVLLRGMDIQGYSSIENDVPVL